MNENILTSFNWLDLLMVIVMIGAVLRGTVQGFVGELFKLLGLICATIFALHFYVRAAEAFRRSFLLSVKFGEVLSFVLISVLVILIFKLIREGWLLILKVDTKSSFSQWLGGFVAIFNALLICGLLFFFISLFKNDALNIFAEKSVKGVYLRDLSPRIYKASYHGALYKFFPDEVINEKALRILKKESVLK
jgi:uncharacterized membrane protein required for colicin V production